MKNCILFTHLPRFSIFFIEELAKQNMLRFLVVEVQDRTYLDRQVNLIKRVWRFLLYYFRKWNTFCCNIVWYKKYYRKLSLDTPELARGIFFPKSNLNRIAKKYSIEIIYTDKVNSDERVKAVLTKNKLDYALILGGTILKKELMNCTTAKWINGHGGVLPMYRGLNSEYWAIRNHDYSNIGITIHEATANIDEGKILEISKIDYKEDEDFISLLIRNSKNLVITYLNVLQNIETFLFDSYIPDATSMNYYKKLQFDITSLYNKKCCQIQSIKSE